MDKSNPPVAIRIWKGSPHNLYLAPGWYWKATGVSHPLSPHSSYNAARLSARRWANKQGYGRIDYFRSAP